MSWIVALSVGAGLGLAYFGGLWLTVLGVLRRPSRAVLVPVSGIVRFILLAVGFAMLAGQGAGSLVAALGGLWLSRWFMLRRIGGVRPWIARDLSPAPLFHLGPIEVTPTVVYSIIASAVVIAIAWLVRLGLGRRPSGWPVAAELLVEHFEELMRDMFDCDPRPYTPLIVTLALFIAAANLDRSGPRAAFADRRFLDNGRAGGGRVLRRPLLRHSGPRRPRLPGPLPRTVAALASHRDHHRVLPDPGARRSTVWQRDERGVDHRRPALARRPTGSRSDHDARRVDERVAGLHLRGPDDRLLERGREDPQTERGISNHDHAIDVFHCLHGGGRGNHRVRLDRPGHQPGARRRLGLDAIARQPDASDRISRTLLIGLAMIESLAIYSLVIALIILLANPFLTLISGH